MIGHMRHGAPPRLMAPQSIGSTDLQESHQTPSPGNRITASEGGRGRGQSGVTPAGWARTERPSPKRNANMHSTIVLARAVHRLKQYSLRVCCLLPWLWRAISFPEPEEACPAVRFCVTMTQTGGLILWCTPSPIFAPPWGASP